MKGAAPDNEQVLLSQIASGDSDAYAVIYSRYAHRLYRFLFPFTNQSKEEAEEVVQDTFLKIWVKRESLIGLRSFEAYLFKMAKNQLIDIRKRNQHLQIIKASLTVVEEPSGSNVYADVIYGEYYQAATVAVNQLSPQRRKIYEMRTQQDMAIDEIAEKLNITSSAVKKQLYEAINFIKHHLRHETGWPILLLLISILS